MTEKAEPTRTEILEKLEDEEMELIRRKDECWMKFTDSKFRDRAWETKFEKLDAQEREVIRIKNLIKRM